jgi:hypothetical protein
MSDATQKDHPVDHFVVSIPKRYRDIIHRFPVRKRSTYIALPLALCATSIPLCIIGIEYDFNMGMVGFVSMIGTLAIILAVLMLQRKTVKRSLLPLARTITGHIGQGERFRNSIHDGLMQVLWDKVPVEGTSRKFSFKVDNGRRWEATLSPEISTIAIAAQRNTPLGSTSLPSNDSYIYVDLPVPICARRKRAVTTVMVPFALLLVVGTYWSFVVVPEAYTGMALIATGVVTSAFPPLSSKLLYIKLNREIAALITSRLGQTPAFQEAVRKVLQENKFAEVRRTPRFLNADKLELIFKSVVFKVDPETSWSIKMTQDGKGYRLKRLP